MLPYSILMFVFSVPFMAVSLMIYHGRTDLIHSYHQTNVKDNAAYGKAFGKASFVVALAPLISGILGLFANSNLLVLIAVFVLIAGMIGGFFCILAVQKKYNNGLF